MATVQCHNGHIYDNRKHTHCPYCPVPGLNDVKIPGTQAAPITRPGMLQTETGLVRGTRAPIRGGGSTDRGGKLIDGKIEIVRQINTGTYFDAYEATDTLFDRPVFLKVARASNEPSAATIVEAHVHRWRELARENVQGMPAIFNIGQDDERWFLTTEWIRSPPLRTLRNITPETITAPAYFLIHC